MWFLMEDDGAFFRDRDQINQLLIKDVSTWICFPKHRKDYPNEIETKIGHQK